jgi:hypothetical protein
MAGRVPRVDENVYAEHITSEADEDDALGSRIGPLCAITFSKKACRALTGRLGIVLRPLQAFPGPHATELVLDHHRKLGELVTARAMPASPSPTRRNSCQHLVHGRPPFQPLHYSWTDRH